MAILTINDLCKRYSISRATLHKFVREGTLPKGFYLGGKAHRWLSEDLDEFDRRQAG